MNPSAQVAAMSFVDVAVRLAVGAVVAMAVLPKIRHPYAFARAVGNYRILPRGIVRFIAPVLIVIEGLSAFMLLIGLLPDIVIPLAGAFFIVFIIAVGANLRRGRHIACGCFGDDSEEISFKTLVRLFLLLIAVAFLGATSLGDHGRSPSLPWLISHKDVLALLVPAACTAAFGLMIGAWALTIPELASVLRQIRVDLAKEGEEYGVSQRGTTA